MEAAAATLDGQWLVSEEADERSYRSNTTTGALQARARPPGVSSTS